ncbi:MAG: hypothetical protein VKK04_01065 [Synechococcales bacterium]|nr:hypothetical protein [Synechococcales bacterium]
MMYRSDHQPDILEASRHQPCSSSEAIPSAKPTQQRSQASPSLQEVQALFGELTPNKRAVIETLLTQWLSSAESMSYSDPTQFRHAS